MPGSIADFLYCILTFVILFGGIPAIIWYFLPKPVSTYVIALIYVGLIIVFGGIYMLVFSTSRTKYRDIVNAGNNARKRIRNNKKVIDKISKNIKKDKDDTQYGLENYNAQLEDIRIKLEDLAAKRKDALKAFDESTKQAVTDEIKNAAQEEIDGYKSRLSELTVNLSGIRDYIKQKKIYIAENYEVFLGKEIVDTENLKALLKLSEKNQTATISELIELYKQPEVRN